MTESSVETPLRIALAVLIALAIPVGVYHRIRAARTGERFSRREEGWPIMIGLRLCMGVAWLMALTWLVDPRRVAWGVVPLPVVWRWAGIGLVALAVPLMIWMFVHLAHNVTDTVHVRRNNTLVTSGPYRWVRHPMYASASLLLAGMALAMANVVIGLVGALGMSLIWRRTAIEEAKLIERHGDAYRVYMLHTGRFWPRARTS
ncbi:MAG TPA: isoprenylcysteine carboxylmethyltransferase family protein [Candidatus Limnocylindria bacterium]|nr:isoprenylcysteine carboxylmethyltransferase family protein [Candidatus Limnocylindria bacterium]